MNYMSSSLSAKFLKIMKIPSQILTDLVACEVAWEGGRLINHAT